MSLASICGSISLVIAHLILDPQAVSENIYTTIALVVSSVLIIVRHRSNVVRLWQGKENKFSFEKKKSEIQ
jgi:glycerol-3-phosphate acyltransferase PlsY